MSTNLSRCVEFFWDKIFWIDGCDAVFVRGEKEIPIRVSLDSVEDIAETVYSSVKIRSEVLAFLIRAVDFDLLPERGDKIRFEGKEYILVPVEGRDYYIRADVERTVLKVAGYKNE